jgi:SAM-dependent methyltransferase
MTPTSSRDNSESASYWNNRATDSCLYKGEHFYTITPVPYYYARRKLLLSLLCEVLSDDAVRSVCDFGCGDGYYLNYFSKMFAERNWMGLEISESMLSLAKLNCPNVNYQLSNTGILGDAKFCLVYSSAVFAHLKDDTDVLQLFQNISEHLSPNGKFVVFEQTGSKRTSGNLWCRRQPEDYVSLAKRSGLELQSRALIAFPAHRIFEKWFAPFFIKCFCSGSNSSARKLSANRSKIYRLVSALAIRLTRSPLKRESLSAEGNTFFVFAKASST